MVCKNRVGEKRITKQGCWAEIIEWFNALNCTIQFENGVVIKNKEYKEFTKGSVRNPYHPSVCGVGYMGVGNYKSTINRKTTIHYSAWSGILNRCYKENTHDRNTTYKICAVDERWHNFQVFAEWYEESHNSEIMEGWEVDKDIAIKGNKIYSLETCFLVPPEINKLFMKSTKNRGEYPIGVRKNGNRFTTSLRGKHIGYFKTIEEAFQAYKTAKESLIKEVADKYRGQITEECYFAMINYKVEKTD